MVQFCIGLMTSVYPIPSSHSIIRHYLPEVMIVGHVVDPGLPLSALLLQPP